MSNPTVRPDKVAAKAGKVMNALFRVLATKDLELVDVTAIANANRVTEQAVFKALGVYQRMGYVSISNDEAGNFVYASATDDSRAFMREIGVL